MKGAQTLCFLVKPRLHYMQVVSNLELAQKSPVRAAGVLTSLPQQNEVCTDIPVLVHLIVLNLCDIGPFDICSNIT